jgi:hypothetical protein
VHFRYPVLGLSVPPIDYHRAGMMVLWVSLIMSVISGVDYVRKFVQVLIRQPDTSSAAP